MSASLLANQQVFRVLGTTVRARHKCARQHWRKLHRTVQIHLSHELPLVVDHVEELVLLGAIQSAVTTTPATTPKSPQALAHVLWMVAGKTIL